jgi:peptide/nickel transport system permease protein
MSSLIDFFKHNRLGAIGLLITGSFMLIAVLSPIIATHDPVAPVPVERFQPPSSSHLFGTDKIGRDVFSRVVYATQIDFFIAILSVSLSISIGVPLGAVAGYLTGRFDTILMRILDAFQAFPAFILAMAVVAALGKSIWIIVAVVAFINFPAYMRLVRAEMKKNKEILYTEAARSVGNPVHRIIFRHLLPNSLNPVFAQAPLNAGWAILLAAGLSFVGLGVPLPTPEWGSMINEGVEAVVTGEWWIAFFPGLATMIAVLGFNLFAEGLRDMLDPKGFTAQVK